MSQALNLSNKLNRQRERRLKVKHFIFKVTLSGYGNSPEEAFRDAVKTFVNDPGSYVDEDWKELVDDEIEN